GETKSIIIGIAPHSSTRIILESHQDLRVFLENYFKRPVQIVTAKNFSEFAQRSNQGSFYDLILTSPNLAFIAKKEASYTPIMTYTKGLSTIILCKNNDILNSKKLPLKVIGLDPVSFATLNGEDWLEKQGLEDGRDIVYSYSSASDSAAAILINNSADMTIMSLPNYLKLTDDVKQKVNILYQSPPQPSRIYLAKDGNGITLKAWNEALKSFMTSEDGAKHLVATKLEGFKMLAPHELDKLEKIANKTLKRLDANN
ncbi:MAG: PhnD/SsuA/transferrin family substrate-binding protein, partial [Arcobacter sp.]|nr:PhnD/SsuA/transferrin family substrate-binding protein [Arcobacter sp.]